MRIGINASFLRKQNTGIGQVTANFLRKLAEISNSKFQIPNNKEIEFILYLEEDLSPHQWQEIFPKQDIVRQSNVTEENINNKNYWCGDVDLPENFSKKVFLPRLYKRDDIFRAIWWQKYSLPKKAKKDKCDFFISMYQCATVMPRKIDHLMIVHDIILELFPNYLNNWRKKFFWKTIKKGIKKADKIVAVSKRTEKDLIQILGIDSKVITVSHIAADEIYSKEVSEEESRRVLEKYGLEKGYIYSGGGLEMRKNVENTIRAYKILLEESNYMFAKIKKVPPLVISGKLMPELAPLVTDARALVKSMELDEKVKLLDFVQQEDLPALYKNSAMFVFPSLYEGFGLPVLEAMSQGTPVLTSKKSSLPEVGSDAVLYCNPDDIEDIALVMKNILTRENVKKTLSEKGLKRSKNFSWDKFTEKILNIIKNETSTSN